RVVASRHGLPILVFHGLVRLRAGRALPSKNCCRPRRRMDDKVSAATIAAALGKTCRSGTWWRCRCPVHASRGSYLALRDGKWGLIVKCWAGCDPRDIRTELCRLGLIGDPNLEHQHPLNSTELERQRAAQEYRDCHSRAAALDIWNNGTVDP